MERFSETRSYAFSSEAAAYLQQGLEDDPKSYIGNELRESNDEIWAAGMAARVFDPVEDQRGYNPVGSNARAFLYGEVLGLEIANEYVSPDARIHLTNLLKMPVFIPDTSPLPRESKNNFARVRVMTEGYEGWMLAEPYYEGLFNYWESALIKQDSDHLTLRLGFGYVMNQLNKEELAHEPIDSVLERILGETS